MSRRLSVLLFTTVVSLAFLPTAARAQSAIAGVVKDPSGAVLPGVNVEAASDVLIERARSVVTDGTGQYKIVDLRPGTYVVTFTLQGFQSLKRENVQLPAEFTATINAEMKVGAIEESVTVSADSPVVDVTTAVHTQVLNRETIDAIPTGRTIQGMGQLIVGVNLNLPDTGGARAMQQTYMSTHGMTTANNTVLVDGMIVNGLQTDGAVQSYFNDAMNQEVSYQTSGIGADTSSGGVRLNMIPREGGNRFSGDFKTAYRPGTWQSSNLTDRHKASGLDAGTHTDRIVDFTAAEGGPIKKNTLWFFASARYFSVNNFIANTVLDDGSQGIDDQYIKSARSRLTWQVSPRNKFSAYSTRSTKYRGHDMQSLEDPETAAVRWFSPACTHDAGEVELDGQQPPDDRRRVLEQPRALHERVSGRHRQGRGTPDWFAATSRLESDLGGRKTAATSETTQSPARYNVQGAASYVTGSHSVKAGFQYQWGTFRHTLFANGDLTQVYRSNSTGNAFTVPDSVTVRNTPLTTYGERLNHDVAFYAQDSWTMKRLTVNMGLRWEALNAMVEAVDAPAGRFVPARHFDAIENLPDWRDWAPRFATVFDLFGNAKTALKYSLNRYNRARTTGIASNYNPLLSQTASVQWRDLNGDDIAQGSVTYLPDGTRVPCVYQTAGCEINVAALPSNFGVAALNTFGDYPRTWNLEHGLELQHELMPRLSVTAAWFHGAFHNLTTTINQSLTASGDPLQNPNYVPLTIYNPMNGEPITVYTRTVAAGTLPVQNLDTFDPERQQIYNAYNFEFRFRPGRGAQLFGGIAIERQLEVNCTTPDNPNSIRFCDDRDNSIPFSRNLKLAGSYPLPWGIQLSGAFQSNQGPSATSTATTRNMVATRGTTRYPSNCPSPCPAGAVILPATFIGSPTAPTSLTVALVPYNTAFVERITQLDFKVSKNFRAGRYTVAPTLEVFNVNNSDAIISYVSTNFLSASYEKPNSIMQPRMVGVGAVVRW